MLLLALALPLGACGRADQAAQQPTAVPLSPAPVPPPTLPAIPTLRPSPVIFRPTPDEAQRAATATASFIETAVAGTLNNAHATSTAKANWALTPEPTILPAPGYAVLRDIWPASPQQAAAPSRLYLRSPSYDEWDPDLFWEVRLPNAQLRRLPVVEQPSLGDTALVSPDSRFLAYVTGRSPTLRVFDLASDADTGIETPMNEVRGFCHRRLAWSPDGRILAVLALNGPQPSWTSQLLLFDPRGGAAP